jgi:hypothetical protein
LGSLLLLIIIYIYFIRFFSPKKLSESCLCVHHALKMYGCGGIDPRILNLNARWRWVKTVPFGLLTSGERALGTRWIGCWVGQRESCMHLPCTESRSSPSQAVSIAADWAIRALFYSVSCTVFVGRAIAQAVSLRLFTAEVRVRLQGSPCGICGEKWHWDRFFFESFCFSLSISFHRCSIFTHVSSGGMDNGSGSGHSSTVSPHRNIPKFVWVPYIPSSLLAFLLYFKGREPTELWILCCFKLLTI